MDKRTKKQTGQWDSLET